MWRDPEGLVFLTSTTLTDFKDRQKPFYKPYRFNLFCQLLSSALPLWWKVLFNGPECHPLCCPPPQRGSPLPFSEGSSQAFADRLAEALTSHLFKETKTIGEASRGRRGAGGKEEWPAKWERRRIERDRLKGRKKKHIEPMKKYNLLTIWLGGWQQPSSVFLELYNTPNYSVRKIKESQRSVKWKKRAKSSQWATNFGGVQYVCCSVTILTVNITWKQLCWYHFLKLIWIQAAAYNTSCFNVIYFHFCLNMVEYMSNIISLSQPFFSTGEICKRLESENLFLLH